MKKVFYFCVVFFTFAVCMMSCSETMGLYEDEGFGMKVAQRQFPVDYDQLANDLDSLGLLYGRDVIVYGVPDIEYQSVLKLTANAMRSISEREVGNCFVLITDDEIVKDSLSGHRSVNPESNENVEPGSHTFFKTPGSFLVADITISWSNQGAFASITDGYYINARHIDMIVESDCVRIDGHVSVVKDGEIVYFDPVTHDPLYSIAYGFSGVSNDSWEIHLYPGTCNE